jgi:protein gp37
MPKLREHIDVWNPWEGCIECSEGCKFCTAKASLEGHHRSFTPHRCTSTWDRPAKWQATAVQANEHRIYGVCFTSDFFLPQMDSLRNDAWIIIKRCPNIFWLIETKRASLIADRLPADWDDGYRNVALGVTAELKKYHSRIDILRSIPAAFRYLDISPCLENPMPELAEHLDCIGWVLINAEHGTKHKRPFDPAWARSVRDLCQERGIAFSHYSRLDGQLHRGLAAALSASTFPVLGLTS